MLVYELSGCGFESRCSHFTMLVEDNIDRLGETLSGKCLILQLKGHILELEAKSAIFQKELTKAKKSKNKYNEAMDPQY